MPLSAEKPSKLENFSAALMDYQEELGYNQMWRWSKRPPRVFHWLVARPKLLEALLKDASNQTQKAPGGC